MYTVTLKHVYIKGCSTIHILGQQRLTHTAEYREGTWCSIKEWTTGRKPREEYSYLSNCMAHERSNVNLRRSRRKSKAKEGQRKRWDDSMNRLRAENSSTRKNSTTGKGLAKRGRMLRLNYFLKLIHCMLPDIFGPSIEDWWSVFIRLLHELAMRDKLMEQSKWAISESLYHRSVYHTSLLCFCLLDINMDQLMCWKLMTERPWSRKSLERVFSSLFCPP